MADLDIPFVNLGQHANSGANGLLQARPQMQPDGSMARARRVHRLVNESSYAVRSWRTPAMECRNFYDNHQWDDYDRLLMNQSRRPILTFNEIKKVMRLICGIERLNRTEVRFQTRALDSEYMEDLMGELATEAVIAVDELSDAHYERSLVFLDVIINGMGWLETYMSYEDDSEGQVLKEHLPQFEMLWDHNSRRSGLADARWRARKRMVPREEFKRRWGQEKLSMVDAMTSEVDDFSVPKYNLVTPYFSIQNQESNPGVGDNKGPQNGIEVIQFQERVESVVYKLVDENSPGGIMELDQVHFDYLREEFHKESIPLPQVVRQPRMIHRQTFVSEGIELEEPVDLPGNRYSLLCMTGEWDEKRKIWIGLGEEMLDPQRTKNKSLSAALNFYLSNAKGGLLFETGAFLNEAQAKEQWSSPNPWIPLNEGALADRKIMPRTPTDMPASLQAFFEIGTRAITDNTGISMELLGLAQQEVGGPVQRSRINAGLAILGWVFDEYDRFKRNDAITTLEFARDFMTNGQLIQIGGAENARAVPLIKSNLPVKYRMTLDQSMRQNPNLKAQVWQDLMPIVPALLRFNAGNVLLSLLKFSPLPAQVVNDIRRGIAEQASQEEPERGRGKQDPPELLAAKVAKTAAEAERARAQARSYRDEAQAKIAELYLQGFRLTSDLANEQARDEHSRGMDREQSDREERRLELERNRWSLEVLKLLESMVSGPEARRSEEHARPDERSGNP